MLISLNWKSLYSTLPDCAFVIEYSFNAPNPYDLQIRQADHYSLSESGQIIRINNEESGFPAIIGTWIRPMLKFDDWPVSYV